VIDRKQLHKQLHPYPNGSARRALSFARAVRNTLQAEEDFASMCIHETEEYLALLRESRANIKMQVAEANEQITLVQEVLESDGISEISLSDDEDSSSTSSPPHSSDFICLEALNADTNSDRGRSAVVYNSPKINGNTSAYASSSSPNSNAEGSQGRLAEDGDSTATRGIGVGSGV